MENKTRKPYKRMISKDVKDMEMNLPEGKYCKDCYHLTRCMNIYGRIEMDEVCDWYPSKFMDDILEKTEKIAVRASGGCNY